METQFSQSFGTANVSGATSFGRYDADLQFQVDAQRFARRTAEKLGFPVVQVELFDSQIYSAYEESIDEYSSLINTANMKYYLTNLLGQDTSSQMTHKYPLNNLDFLKRMTEPYAKESGLNTPNTLYSASIVLNAGQQLYDLRNVIPDIHKSSSIDVLDVLHFAPAAINRSLSSWYGGQDSAQFAFSQEFGADFGLIGDATLFYLYPMTFTVQRAQQVELSDRIRRSEFTWRLYDNVLQIFPVPQSTQQGLNVWFTYYPVVHDGVTRYSKDSDPSISGTSDISNVPYDYMNYSSINSIGKKWIQNYAFEIVKETLGRIRSKFNTLPIPNAEITLDGQTLVSDAKEERTKLREQLLKDLEELDPKKQIVEEAAAYNAILDQYSAATPLGIYIM